MRKPSREYQAAIAINGNIPDLHLQLGINYSALGIYDQAVQEFSNANALNPADPMPDYLTSRTYATVGEFAKARQYAETAVKDEPTSAAITAIWASCIITLPCLPTPSRN